MVIKTRVTRMFSVKNYEGAEILLNVKAIMSACHCFRGWQKIQEP